MMDRKQKLIAIAVMLFVFIGATLAIGQNFDMFRTITQNNNQVLQVQQGTTTQLIHRLICLPQTDIIIPQPDVCTPQEPIQQIDENGLPVFDENGLPVMIPQLDVCVPQPSKRINQPETCSYVDQNETVPNYVNLFERVTDNNGNITIVAHNNISADEVYVTPETDNQLMNLKEGVNGLSINFDSCKTNTNLGTKINFRCIVSQSKLFMNELNGLIDDANTTIRNQAGRITTLETQMSTGNAKLIDLQNQINSSNTARKSYESSVYACANNSTSTLAQFKTCLANIPRN